ncbi:MAG: Na+ ATPase [Bogoriella megaspora]|nr:MAG: Na+ ATPase [Bogoriella megaspora]
MKRENTTSSLNQNILSRPAHALPYAVVIEETKANADDGLRRSEAHIRLDRYGRNDLGDGDGVQPFKILLRQIVNSMTMILVLAMAVSFGIQSWIEGGVITAVICLNVSVGFINEFNAEKTMDSLRSLSSPTALVVREGKSISIPTVELVPGDLLELKTGDTVPADIRITECANFETDEALLTGESLPVRKNAEAVFEDATGPGDRLNIAYSSSTVTKGRAAGIVFATGMSTEIGSIAAALRQKGSTRRPVKRKPDGSAKPHRYAQAWGLTFSDAIGRFLGVNVGTPLQQKLSRLAMLLFGVAIICAIIVLAANGFSNQQEVIIYAVATGLSMIPASLIVVLTITMAAGTKRMVERNVIVRNLKSLEALGAVTDICSDKTGTLTQGKMIAKKAWIPAKGTYTVGTTNEPFNPSEGDLYLNPLPPGGTANIDEKSELVQATDQLQDNKPLVAYLNVASLANLANVHHSSDGWHARGDPTEVAIQVFASRFDWNRSKWMSKENPVWKQLIEFPFDSDVKKMSVLLEESATHEQFVFTKGAVERILESCTSVYLEGNQQSSAITEDFKRHALANMDALASTGLRVLALASRKWDNIYDEKQDIDREDIERDLTFRGLIGLYDPPRLESAGAVAQCHQAGVNVHMLTGDHPGTATAIAKEVGILPRSMDSLSKSTAHAMIMTARDFDALSDAEIDSLPTLPLVVARCAPSTKVRMIEALHRRKAFAAMTGDGVNDSPSLKRADVGISMGLSGSDVAKDASDIVLTDDNFASILNAICEGRRIFDNIQKFILHLLGQNIAQACILLIGLVFKDAGGTSVFPIAPVEIMWIIMITSSLPDMGLGFEAASPDVLRRPPVSLKRGVFSPEILLDMLVYGLWIAALCLAAFTLVLYAWGNGELGSNCNESLYNDLGEPICDTVFRARATTFACLTWFSLFLAWEMMDLRRSFFRLHPDSPTPWTQWMKDIWRNQFLFWSIVAGFVTIFPTVYIPVLNRAVFKHIGITWEWAIVLVTTVAFFLGVEAWKWAKRVYFRHAGKECSPQDSAVSGDDESHI